MNVENYDYKTEWLQEKTNLEPRNALVDPQTLKEWQSVSKYLQSLDQKIQDLERGLQVNNGVDRQQQEALNALNEKNTTLKTQLSSGIENRINADPQLQESLRYAFVPEGDARLKNLNRAPESAKQIQLETGTVAVA